MSLSPRLVAIQGIGLNPIALAVQGFLDEVVVVAPSVVFAAGSGTRSGGGPDAQVSMADYLKRFGKPATAPTAIEPAQPNAQPRTLSARKKRQRMEEEIFALTDF